MILLLIQLVEPNHFWTTLLLQQKDTPHLQKVSVYNQVSNMCLLGIRQGTELVIWNKVVFKKAMLKVENKTVV